MKDKYLFEIRMFDGLQNETKFLVIYAGNTKELFDSFYSLNVDYSEYKVFKYVNNMGYISLGIAP